MIRSSPVLAYPLKVIRWFTAEIYKNSSEIRLEAERAIQVFYEENKDNLERHGIAVALVKYTYRIMSICLRGTTYMSTEAPSTIILRTQTQREIIGRWSFRRRTESL